MTKIGIRQSARSYAVCVVKGKPVLVKCLVMSLMCGRKQCGCGSRPLGNAVAVIAVFIAYVHCDCG
jgi:hypothetical protein